MQEISKTTTNETHENVMKQEMKFKKIKIFVYVVLQCLYQIKLNIFINVLT